MCERASRSVCVCVYSRFVLCICLHERVLQPNGSSAFSISFLNFTGKFRVRGLKVLFYIYLSVHHYFRG